MYRKRAHSPPPTTPFHSELSSEPPGPGTTHRTPHCPPLSLAHPGHQKASQRTSTLKPTVHAKVVYFRACSAEALEFGRSFSTAASARPSGEHLADGGGASAEGRMQPLRRWRGRRCGKGASRHFPCQRFRGRTAARWPVPLSHHQGPKAHCGGERESRPTPLANRVEERRRKVSKAKSTSRGAAGAPCPSPTSPLERPACLTGRGLGNQGTPQHWQPFPSAPPRVGPSQRAEESQNS